MLFAAIMLKNNNSALDPEPILKSALKLRTLPQFRSAKKDLATG
jgi:hypothetical protein